MLPKVSVSQRCCSEATSLEPYRSLVGDEVVEAIQGLSRELRGVRVCHLNSTASGGGVAEAFWKARAIVAGSAGGIPMQFPQGYEDYLVTSVEQCAERLRVLLDHPDVAEAFGQAAKTHVRQRFLLPRLIRDELALIQQVVAG